MVAEKEIVRTCGRCEAILVQDELENQRYEGRWRCEACDPIVSTTGEWLHDASIHAPTDEEAHDEWVRRVRIAELTPQVVRDRVSLWGRVPRGRFQ